MSDQLINREPAVAGKFYPADSRNLKDDLTNYFRDAAIKVDRSATRAIIVPHAGYLFSGAVAANGYMQVDPDKEFENIFLIGSSHTTSFDGASIYAAGHFKSPLGLVPVNLELARELLETDVFNGRLDVHTHEHSLEVQLPFLQHHLKKAFRIIPVIISTSRPETCRKIARALLPWLNDSNLFVISTDFSHYPAYDAAIRTDRKTAKAIALNNPDQLLTAMDENETEGIKNLSTSLCGWSSVLTFLHMTCNKRNVTIQPVDYKNSGDLSVYGNRDHVVGYYAMAVSSDTSVKPSINDENRFSADDEKQLIDIVRTSFLSYALHGVIPDLDSSTISNKLKNPEGAFITLYKGKQVRGCVGRFKPHIPLYLVVQEMAIAAAFYDERFDPVEASELSDVHISISVLSPLRKINSIGEITLGRHGIFLKKGNQTGTYLPQVVNKTGWTVEEFLGHCAQDKADIGWNGWKSADIYTFETYIIKEH